MPGITVFTYLYDVLVQKVGIEYRILGIYTEYILILTVARKLTRLARAQSQVKALTE